MNAFRLMRSPAAALLALALGLSAAIAQEKKEHQLQDKTSEALKKVGELQSQQPMPVDAMLTLVEGTLKEVAPGSYDRAFMLDIYARLLLQKEQLNKAIEPWEEALKLSDQHQYFDEKKTSDIYLILAQVVFTEATTIKDTAAQRRGIDRAAAYLKRHLAAAPKPSLDTQMFYAQLLYQQAVADDKNINQELLGQAQEVVQKAMQTAIHPKESFYMLMLAILQQKNDVASSAELLEIIVKKFPNKRDYWPLLMATYLNLASQEKDPSRQKELYVRAILTMERAQSFGFMKSPKDFYNLVTIYSTAGQFSLATEIMHNGLKNGNIESTPANWRILASFYQQSHKDLMAIDALKEAAKLFPKEGAIDLHIGELYRQLERPREARDYYRGAIRKGGLEKPHIAHQLVAYTSMELEDWEEALRAITEAAKHRDFMKDQQMVNLKVYIEDNVNQRREAAKEKAALQQAAGQKQAPAPEQAAPKQPTKTL